MINGSLVRVRFDEFTTYSELRTQQPDNRLMYEKLLDRLTFGDLDRILGGEPLVCHLPNGSIVEINRIPGDGSPSAPWF